MLINNIDIVDIDFTITQQIYLPYNAYIPESENTEGIFGTWFNLHKNYIIIGKHRRFNDVRTLFASAGTQTQCRCDIDGLPVFFA